MTSLFKHILNIFNELTFILYDFKNYLVILKEMIVVLGAWSGRVGWILLRSPLNQFDNIYLEMSHLDSQVYSLLCLHYQTFHQSHLSY